MAFFKDVIGQDDVKQLLIHNVRSGKMPHALLLTGPSGSGKLPMALALSRYLLCHHPGEEDACGQCNSCKMMDHLAHPDMHFVFPVVKKRRGVTWCAMNSFLNGAKCWSVIRMPTFRNGCG